MDFVSMKSGDLVNNVTKVIVEEKLINQQSRDEKQLRQYLLEGYDNQVWPWYAEQKACNVSIEFNFYKILAIDMSKGILQLAAQMRLWWYDPRLSWNASEWNGIRTTYLEDEEFHGGEFWNPRIELWNSEKPMGLSFYPISPVVRHTGQLSWIRNGKLDIACNFKGQDLFPYDHSSCVFEFGSWVYDESRVDINIFKRGYFTGYLLTSGEKSSIAQYKLVDIKVTKHIYETFQGKRHPVVLYQVIVSRSYLNFLTKVMMPQFFLSLVSLCALWFSPASSERVSLVITVPVALAVYDLLVYQQLPETSQMVFASSYGLVCFLFSMFSVLETVVTVVLWYMRDPYLASPQRSTKKLYLHLKDQQDWVVFIKVVDEELAKLGTLRKLGNHRSQRILKLQKRRNTYKQQRSQSKSSSGQLSIVQATSDPLPLTNQPSMSREIQMTKRTKSSNLNYEKQSEQNEQSTSQKDSVTSQKTLQQPSMLRMETKQSSVTISEIEEFGSGGLDDISWVDNMTLANLTSIEDVQDLLTKIVHLQANVKGRAWVGASIARLVQHHGFDAVYNRILELVGYENEQIKPFYKIYRVRAADFYNQKWRMLSRIIDRVCQTIFIPLFLGFVFTMFLLVIKADKSQVEEVFQQNQR